MEEHVPCERYAGLLSDYADGRLKGAKRQAVETHLAACKRCTGFLEEIARLRRLVVEEPVPEPSAAFWEGCMEALAATARTRRFSTSLPWKPALGISLSVAALLLLLMLPPVRQLAAPPTARHAVALAEIPESEYIMQHARFAVARSLGATSHYVFLSARAAEEDKSLDRLYDSEDAGLLHDEDAAGRW